MIQSPVLVLNRSYAPVRVTSAKRAFSMLYRGVARALNEDFELLSFDEWVSLPATDGRPTIGLVNRSILLPRVILLSHYNSQPRKTVRFSRLHVLMRDQFTCQYCGRRLARRELNLDHVIPKRYGGTTCWENVVCCCLPCNRKKGGRTPEEAGMRLIRTPKAPSYGDLTFIIPQTVIVEEWKPFLRARTGA